VWREPPYTEEEEFEFYRRVGGATSLTVAHGPRPPVSPQKSPQPSPAAACGLLLDVSERPIQLVTLDADNELLDFVGEFTDLVTAHEAAEAEARACGLPLSIKDEPGWISAHFARLRDTA